MNNKVLISSYNKFDVLAHIPKGIESKYSLSCNTKYYSFNLCENPAFILKHPELDFFYICCESIFGGKIGTFSYKDNDLKEVSYVNSCGKSSCYLTFDDNNENIININYWNSTISIHPVKNGILLDAIYVYSSGEKQVATNIEEHLSNRHSEPHFHSAVFHNNILYVADLGKDRLHLFTYKNNEIKFIRFEQLTKNNGPRYLRILNNQLYIVNEISSTVDVFSINKDNTFTFKQTISTIPDDYNGVNTCGNIMIHPNNKLIYVSNRGHDSISVYKINDSNYLELVNIYSSYGKTPRHFNFNKDGRLLYVANQDSNNVSLFKINTNDGTLEQDRIIECNSPNFVILF